MTSECVCTFRAVLKIHSHARPDFNNKFAMCLGEMIILPPSGPCRFSQPAVMLILIILYHVDSEVMSKSILH